MNALKSLCEEYLIATISIESVSDFLLFADLHNSEELKNCCIDYITNNATKVMSTKGWSAVATNRELILGLFKNLALKHDDCV